MTATTRHALHRVAAHVMGRRRFQVSGRFGLRASPGGFTTPAFGDGPEVLRIAGTCLVRELGGEARFLPVEGASLRELVDFAEADLDTPFTAGDEGPELGDPDEPMKVDPGEARTVASWFSLGWRVLDEVLAAQPAESAPATVQLWPEHFDVGTSTALPSGERVNLGFSPGDEYEPDPYVYLGPWGERHGEPAFWNAPFGAVLRASHVLTAPDPAVACAGFLFEGIRQASSP